VTRVVVADDQPVVLQGFAAIIGAAPDLEVVGAAKDGRELLDLVAREQPDVAVVDVRMPVLDGIAATQRISAEHPSTRVLILTTFDLDEYVYDALRAVARGLSNAEIGAELWIAEPTVKSHVSEALRKLGCRDRVQLVIAAYESGLVGS